MTEQEYEAAIAAFIAGKGVTRCPTACAGHTQAAPAEADRVALRQRAAEIETRRAARRARDAALFGAGVAA